MERSSNSLWSVAGAAAGAGLLVVFLARLTIGVDGLGRGPGALVLGASVAAGVLVGAKLSSDRVSATEPPAVADAPPASELFEFAERLPFLVWVSDRDSLGKFFNQRWREFRGRTIEEEQGQGWLAGIHKDDVQGCTVTYLRAFRAREPYELIYRLKNAGGDYRWVFARGDQLLDSEGSFVGYLTCCLDVTEGREVEEALRQNGRELEESSRLLKTLSAQLLNAQETERRRLARELHDAVGQDLTAFIINLRNLQRSAQSDLPPGILEEGIRLVERMLQRVRDLTVELRPSMLDDLGLVSALRWYVDRQAKRSGVEAQFAADFVDVGLNADQQTACFRVAQEALTNAVRHGAPRRIQIKLQQKGENLELSVADDGMGFDVVAARERAIGGGSLGLLSMEERVVLAGGALELDSTPEGGTVVRARFPSHAVVETL